jgi:hypothetical protein
MLVLDPASVSRVPVWRLPTRVAFRFCVAYFVLYGFPDVGDTGPVRLAVSWVARHVFHVGAPLVISGSGSGDKTYDWVHSFTVLIVSALTTVVWSVLDRRREHYAVPQTWIRLLARFALGFTMVSYGAIKAIPLQMPEPGLTRLLQPFGQFSPMGVLWSSIGASRGYEVFAGCAELAGGILLFIPQTATLGALICLADTVQIFALNMTYDVPVKLFSFHLILLSLFLLAPEAGRLLNVVLLNRAAGPSTLVPIGRTGRRRTIALVAQIAVGAVVVGIHSLDARQRWTQYGGGAPKSALYGIWNVDEMRIDGVTRSPLLTDYDRFRRVIFDRPMGVAFQRMDDTFVNYGVRIDAAANTVTLTLGPTASPGSFFFEQPAADRLVLKGAIDGRAIEIEGRLVDRSSFLLLNRGFHWVQEYPFNR